MSRSWVVPAIAFFTAVVSSAVELKSPDGRFVVSVNGGGEQKALRYAVTFKGKPIITESGLGLELTSGLLGQNLDIGNVTRTTRDVTWRPVCGERAEVRDHCNEMVIDSKQAGDGTMLVLTFRAYNEGVAFAYTLPPSAGADTVVVKSEGSEFRFAEDYPVWATYTAQGLYEKVPTSRM